MSTALAILLRPNPRFKCTDVKDNPNPWPERSDVPGQRKAFKLIIVYNNDDDGNERLRMGMAMSDIARCCTEATITHQDIMEMMNQDVRQPQSYRNFVSFPNVGQAFMFSTYPSHAAWYGSVVVPTDDDVTSRHTVTKRTRYTCSTLNGMPGNAVVLAFDTKKADITTSWSSWSTASMSNLIMTFQMFLEDRYVFSVAMDDDVVI